jgi:hypothetical protein
MKLAKDYQICQRRSNQLQKNETIKIEYIKISDLDYKNRKREVQYRWNELDIYLN